MREQILNKHTRTGKEFVNYFSYFKRAVHHCWVDAGSSILLRMYILLTKVDFTRDERFACSMCILNE